MVSRWTTSHSPSFTKPDPKRPWGGLCTTCKGFCSGHYCEPTFTDVTDKDALKQVSRPPSVYLKKLFAELKGTLVDILEPAKKVLLPKEVGFWYEHLNTVAENRRRGAAKAAETRRRKQQSSTDTIDRCFCGTCETEFRPEMPNIDFWIYCVLN